MGKDTDLLDWDITDAPDPDEIMTRPEVSRPVAASRPHGLSRQSWLLLSSVIVLAIGSISAFSAWNRWRILTQVRQIVSAEGSPLAWPSPLVFPANPASANIQSITALDNYTARAEVARTFRSPTGQSLTFTLAQFYEFARGTWHRISIPEAYWGPAHGYAGERVWINYREVDDGFVKDFGPFVDDVLQRACAEWDCPPQLRLELNFSTDAYSDRLSTSPETTRPNAFRLLLAGVDIDQEIRFPSPHLAGYPADEASALALKQALALQTLMGLANELVGASHRDNAYLYALTARLAARLGLEANIAGEGLTVQRIYEPGELWEMAYARLWQSPAVRDEALRAALGSLNILLADDATPADTEARLFASLRHNFSSADWYAEATGLTLTAAREELQQALWGIYRVGPFATPPDLLMSCSTGPALYHLEEQRLIEFMAHLQTDNAVIASSWSPDGQWVVLFPPQSRQAYVVNVRSGEVLTRDVPVTRSNNFTFSPQAWVSDTTLAYVVKRVRQPSLLRFLDVTQAAPGTSEIENVSAYVLAPDGQLAVVQRADYLELMPALGGQATPLVWGHSPQWSSDGQTLRFSSGSTPPDVALAIYTMASGQSQFILGGQPGQSPIIESTWSPTEDLVALALLEKGSDSFTDNFQIRVSAMSPADPHVRWRDSDLARTVLALSFSADGKLLASLQYDQQHRSAQVVVYEVATGQRLRQIESVYAFAWSPTGHRLAISGASGVYLVTEAPDQADPPKLLTQNECYHLVWNPVQ